MPGWLFLGLYSLTVIFRVWYFGRRGWRQPVKDGERYFLEVEVPPGWHSGSEGRKWWRRYWAAIAVPHLLEAIGFTAIAIWGRWSQLPMLALVAPVIMVFHVGLVVWWRHCSGADRRKPRRVAVTLQQRRLSDYFSWPAEAFMLVLVAGFLAALAAWGDAGTRWRVPVTLTYVVAGLLAVKVAVVRHGWALPAERTRDYERWYDLRRRQAADLMDRVRWMLVAGVAGYAAVHSLAGVLPVDQVRWAAILAGVALWLWMILGVARGETTLDRAGSDLPPPAMPIDWRRGWWSFGVFLAGLAALLIWPRW